MPHRAQMDVADHVWAVVILSLVAFMFAIVIHGVIYRFDLVDPATNNAISVFTLPLIATLVGYLAGLRLGLSS
jgi:hypothetical protein